MFPALFQTFSNVSYWKIDFIVNNNFSIGTSSLVLKQNSLPRNGHCSVDLFQGISLLTYFTITCSNWIDLDGKIVKYEFMGI